MELIGQIARVKRDGNDKPKVPVMLEHIDIVRLVPKQEAGRSQSGSGVFVNDKGDILTNADAVQGCREVHLGDGRKAELAATDRQNGLAILHSDGKPEAVAVFRAGEGIPAQEPVWTLGSSPAFVSATADSHGDNRYLQVNGPDSGGTGTPALDTAGMVAGLFTTSSESPAPGASLAIKASVATGFLDSANIPYTARPASGAADRTAATDNARRYTVGIQCWK
jgi:hypothetical protein